MILVVALDGARCHIERERGGRVKVIARPLIADGRAAVARPPICEIGFRIVVAGYPYRSASGFPLIALRPRLTAGLAGRWNRECAPLLFSGIEIEGCNETTDTKLAAGRADHDSAAGDKRGECDVVPRFVVGNGGCPHFLAGFRIERYENSVACRVINLVRIKRDAAIRLVRY